MSIKECMYLTSHASRHLQVDEGLVACGIKADAPQHGCNHKGTHKRRLQLDLQTTRSMTVGAKHDQGNRHQ